MMPDSLLREAKKVCADRGMTLRELIESGVRVYLDTLKGMGKKKFKLRDGSVKGKGVAPEFQGASWAQIRDAIYPIRGKLK
jgi:hypothetical protein